MELRQKSWRFLESLQSTGGIASRSQLPCVTSREEDRARQECSKKGLAVFSDGKWRLTGDGELALRSKTRRALGMGDGE